MYCTGKKGDPVLLLMQEIAGFSPGLLLFAQRLVAAGFQVCIPWTFGRSAAGPRFVTPSASASRVSSRTCVKAFPRQSRRGCERSRRISASATVAHASVRSACVSPALL